jgi:hypothetical protein
MYSSLPAIIRGWSRIYYAARVGSPWRILLALAFVVLCCFTVFPALGWSIWRIAHPSPLLHGWIGPLWLFTSLSHLGVMTYYLSRMYKWSGNARRNALYFPVAGGLLCYIFLRALKMCITKKVEWRGTAYSHTMQAIPVPAQTSTPAAQPAPSRTPA